MRLYIGCVKKIDENQIISFTINDMYTAEDKMPQAVPLARLSKIAQEGDEVMIYQPNDMIELYYYTQFMDGDKETDYTSIEFNDSHIRVYRDGNVIMTTSGDSGNINIDTSDASSGNISIKSAGSLTIDSGKKITIKSTQGVEFPCNSIQIEGMSTIGFLPLTVISHPGGTVAPTATAPCTGIKLL